MRFIRLLTAWLGRMIDMAIKGTITKHAGDDDTNDIIDHKTGKLK